MADPLSSVSGVSSGVDWKALVEQMIKLDRRPADRMQAAVDANAARKTALAGFRDTVRKLQTATDALRFGGAFAKFTATAAGADASGRTVASAAAGPSAAPGRYAVRVTQLAQAQKNAGSVGFASATTALGFAGALVVGGQRVEVTAADTLAGVRDRLNAVQAQSGVRATLVAANADGTGQRLVLGATRSGAAGAFTVADDPATPATFSPPAPTPPPASLTAAFGVGAATVAAQDAVFTIDADASGAGGVTVTRSANTVSDAIPGVTLTLGALGTSEVAVDRQPGAAADAVKGFVEAFNEVQKAVAAQRAVGADGTAPPLRAEPMLRTLRGNLGAAVLGTASATSASGVATGVRADLATFASAGVSLQKDGTLAFDAARFDAAYGGRVDDLQALLAERGDAIGAAVGALVDPFTGAVDTRSRALDDQSARLAARIADVDARLDKKRTALLAQYARYEAALGRMKSIGDALGAQLAGLTAGSTPR